MSVAATALWEINAGATASNVNGAGFNPGNANFMTDLTTDSNTANTSAPVCSSASYNFVAGDVGHWLYIKSGTNWYPGWYKISSVASNKATLSAAVGSADVVQITNQVTGTAQGTYGTNTAIGCASVGTPTGGVFGIDYSQGTAAIINDTDLACPDGDAASPTVTSALKPFGLNHVGNYIHITAGTGYTASWYEIVSVSVVTATLDRAVGTDGAKTGGTFYVGGALSMNSTLDDDVCETFVAGNQIFLKNNGTISLGESVAITTGIGSATLAVEYHGYNSQRGDAPTGSSRPTLNLAGLSLTGGSKTNFRNIIITCSGGTGFVTGANSKNQNMKITNSSTSTNRPALGAASNSLMFNSELISYRGYGLNLGSASIDLIGCVVHDSSVGLRITATGTIIGFSRCIVHSCNTNALAIVAAYTAHMAIENCTFYGAENKLGTGIDIITGAGTTLTVLNNIFYGFVTGVVAVDTTTNNLDDYNDYFNNTSDVTSNDKWQKGPNDVAINPGFTSVTQITGTGATSSTNVLTDSGKDFTALGVTTNDHIYIVSGTGTGFATATIFGITAVGTTTLTLTSNITSSGAGSDIVYQLTIGNNFLPTGAI